VGGRTIIIIGGGAAGLMAACHAAGPGRRVQLLERTADGGRKILISGGGRCNVLPSQLDERRYVTASSANTMRKILRSWPLADQRAFFERDLELPLVVEPETGKLFPIANRARVVRDALLAAARSRGVDWQPNTQVTDVYREANRWFVTRANGAPLSGDAVVLATGGLSVPATGSDGFGLDLLARLHHTVHPVYPALAPLTLDPAEFADLAGVALTVRLTAHGAESRDVVGGFLFTHRGYSGPAVLDISDLPIRARLAGSALPTLRVRWLDIPTSEWETRLAPAGHHVATAVRERLPHRLADRLVAMAGVAPGTMLSQLTRPTRLRLMQMLTAFPLPFSGDEGYKKAEVTGGGLALDEVHVRTLESRMHPGLFIAGEALDAFGPIGGYNFVWAWTTGRLAGLGATAHPLP
jgi:hypothetical protein